MGRSGQERIYRFSLGGSGELQLQYPKLRPTHNLDALYSVRVTHTPSAGVRSGPQSFTIRASGHAICGMDRTGSDYDRARGALSVGPIFGDPTYHDTREALREAVTSLQAKEMLGVITSPTPRDKRDKETRNARRSVKRNKREQFRRVIHLTANPPRGQEGRGLKVVSTLLKSNQDALVGIALTLAEQGGYTPQVRDQLIRVFRRGRLSVETRRRAGEQHLASLPTLAIKYSDWSRDFAAGKIKGWK
jgi:hypothetical protein